MNKQEASPDWLRAVLMRVLAVAALPSCVGAAPASVDVTRTAAGAVALHYRLPKAVAVVEPDRSIADRVWPSLVTLDESVSVFNLDYVALRDDASQTVVIRNAYDPVARRCRDWHVPINVKSAESGRYVVLASSMKACRALAGPPGAVQVIASTGTPHALRELLGGHAAQLYQSFDGVLGNIVDPPATVLIAYDQTGDRPTSNASAGWNSTVLMRFGGSAWAGDLSRSRDNLLALLAHELAHLWIGRSVTISPRGRSDWLHEGAAEYLASLQLVESGYITAEAHNARVERYVNRCVDQLGDRALLSESSPVRGQSIYDCGVLVQLAYDAALRHETQGKRTVAHLWRDLLANAVASDRRTVVVDDFINSSAAAGKAVRTVLEGPAVDKQAVLAGLRELGVDAREEPLLDVVSIALALLNPFFAADCQPGSTGFEVRDDHLRLDSKPCRSIADGFALRYVAGVDIVEQPRAAFEAAAKTCAAGSELTFSGRTASEPQLVLRCPGPISAPTSIKLRGALGS